MSRTVGLIPQKTICRKIRVNRGGYAYGGRHYFGSGPPLYYVEFPSGACGHVRAKSRAEAIEEAKTRPWYWGIR